MRWLRLGGFEDTQDYQSIVFDVELETKAIVRKSTINKAELQTSPLEQQINWGSGPIVV